jgi:hypothetical protein
MLEIERMYYFEVRQYDAMIMEEDILLLVYRACDFWQLLSSCRLCALVVDTKWQNKGSIR